MIICPSGYTTHAPVVPGTEDCVPVTKSSGDVVSGQGVNMGLGLGVVALAAVSAMFLFVTFGPTPNRPR